MVLGITCRRRMLEGEADRFWDMMVDNFQWRGESIGARQVPMTLGVLVLASTLSLGYGEGVV